MPKPKQRPEPDMKPVAFYEHTVAADVRKSCYYRIVSEPGERVTVYRAQLQEAFDIIPGKRAKRVWRDIGRRSGSLRVARYRIYTDASGRLCDASNNLSQQAQRAMEDYSRFASLGVDGGLAWLVPEWMRKP